MRHPVYTMKRIALADCRPHADAEAYSASSEDRAALSNSIRDAGILSPIAVIPGDEGRGWFVIDGIGRLNALVAAGETETDAQVFDLGDLTVAEFVVSKNAMMRKVTTGTRVMAYLKCHEREVLQAADPEHYAVRGRDTKGRIAKPAVSHDTAGEDKGWSSKEIAARIGVSNHDVLAGIELLKATAAAGAESEEGGGRSAEGGAKAPAYTQLDLFETSESVLRGETPIRRWKAAAGGKVSKTGGKAAADYTSIALRTVKSFRGVWENWQTVPMEMRQIVLDEFEAALAVLPDDFRALLAAKFAPEAGKGRKRG